MSKITEGGLSRRQFLTGSALTAGAVASLGLAGCAPKAPTEAPATGESDLAATGADGSYRTRPCSPVESSVRSETGIEHHLPLTVYRVEDGLAHLAQPRGEIGCRLYRRHLAGHHWRLAHAALREVGRRRRVSGLLRRLRRAVRSLPRYSRRGQVHRLEPTRI